ncbi:hypothetical protein KBZ18_15290 [Synechococcus sp. Cruz-9H2]|uniref:hypothetical protein n=1 Tax=unclassified Synechococcus TaxID=2626047 RepID=UPI0020CD6EE6|nr:MULTISPECIES: hypothetical protein [unclassified Synechococcus]MCP9820848.1 hypothetical protein [Synechococcus sp. Cruz-9H2]MCP9845080.1 hypothetical protein [Synechococcus sp. Edmonson 11F2]MCP9857204.1 hypothetical protein [Synechococcus sp. Cruz-9C9]MCP9864489.1 hypothetical protein [Synechococcus sp. Cruz-7E5]MCP9871758.1 hypothetical protein [Synechococcus sp. Cruz-7B9]
MGYQAEIESGREAFSYLIRAWHERNGWSHRVLPGLAEVLDLGRIHNSQVSMLRNRKLASPGPEVFLALGRINQWMAAPGGVQAGLLAGHPDLIEALGQGGRPLLSDNGVPLGPGDLLEIFVGLVPPPRAFDLRIAEEEAAGLSFALADLLCAGRPWRLCRDQVLAAYPVAKAQRRERFAAVMSGQRDYSASELDAELMDLHRTLEGLGVAAEQEISADRFLDVLRQKARLQQQAGLEDLAAAIRQELVADGSG